MKAYVKEFFYRGLMFGGFGPIILGIIYVIEDAGQTKFFLSGMQVFFAVLSTYFLAFVQAGASIFYQIERWPIAKSLFCHFGTIYVSYLLCYLANTWIPFEAMAVVIFTGIFVLIYFAVWLTVVGIIKCCEKKLNAKIE